MLLQLGQCVTTGCHGEHFGADRASTADIEWSVANDKDLLALQVAFQNLPAPVAGNGGDLIALFMIISEAAGLKDFPKIEVAQFDFRPETYIASQQTEQGRIRQRL